MKSSAIVQVNQGGAWAINTWEVQALDGGGPDHAGASSSPARSWAA